MPHPTPSPAPPAGDVSPRPLSGRERLLRACACQPVDHTPVWLMRQAGRVLPEYRALKEYHTFVELVRDPDLATEVTLQPIRRFGMDAAIIFSDILVIPEALGQPYHFADTGGVHLASPPRDRAAVERLQVEGVRDRLGYVADALRRVKTALEGRTGLIGFSGAPWTLANFMVEGGSGAGFQRARAMFESDRALYNALAERLTRAIIDYLHLQVDAGAEVLQVFDTLAGLLPAELFPEASGRWIREIVGALSPRVPVIVFAKGAMDSWPELLATGAQVLGVDATLPLRTMADRLPSTVAVQGNLPPERLLGTPAEVEADTRAILDSMRGRPGHIFNLGHGVPPTAPLENLSAMIATLRSHA